jgi:hypothetical protein
VITKVEKEKESEEKGKVKEEPLSGQTFKHRHRIWEFRAAGFQNEPRGFFDLVSHFIIQTAVSSLSKLIK